MTELTANLNLEVTGDAIFVVLAGSDKFSFSISVLDIVANV